MRSALRAALLLVLAATTACVGEIGDSTDGGPAGVAPSAPTLHRLTAIQLENSYRELLGEPLDVPNDLPADDTLYGFTSIAAASSTISAVDAEKYEKAAYTALDQVWADDARRAALVGCDATRTSDPCVRAFLIAFTERAWRRPVTMDELDALATLGGEITADLGATTALELVLASVLQSPSFVFRVEIGEPILGKRGGLRRYTSYEMASRVSFLITDAPPDEELLEAARNDDLLDADLLEAQARRLVDDPRARPTLVRFFRDFMQIGNLDHLDKNPEQFPAFSPTLGVSMQTEIERMFESVVFDKERDFRTLFTTRETFVNEELARIYGIEGVTGPDWVPVTLPDDGKRGGLLTTPGFLAMNAQKTRTSPTHRGRFIRVNLLCDDIPPPPAGVNTTLPDPVPGSETTLRERLEQHQADPKCSSCHDKMDPLGFAFEEFDAIGAYRTTEDNGLAIDSSTDLDGTPVASGVEMGKVIAKLPAVGACVARRFYEHAGGHLARSGEEVAVRALVSAFEESDYDFKTLVVATVKNDGFRLAMPDETEGSK